MENQKDDNTKLPEGFLKQLSETKDVIQKIQLEEYQEKFDTVEAIQNRIAIEKKNTQLQKERFINEIKSNLGEELKKSAGEIIYIKRPWYYKISKMFKKLFKTI